MNITEIARLANVSPATVSRVINNSGYASEENRKKVMHVIKENNFTPNSVSRNLRRAKTGLILAAFPDLSNSFYADIIVAMEKRAAEYEYKLIIANTQADKAMEKKYLAMLTSKLVDGYISNVTLTSQDEITAIALQYPFVQSGECTSNLATSSVDMDNYAASGDAVRFLLRKGHKRIGLIQTYPQLAFSGIRHRGYKDALEEYGATYDPDLIKSGPSDHFTGYEACRVLMEVADPPTAIFCYNDETATGAVHCLLDIGKHPGQDVDVIGFDNSHLAEIYLPSISSVAVARSDLGCVAVDLLMEKIRDINSTSKRVMLPHSLVLRESAHE